MIFLFLRSGRDRFSRQTLWKSSISEWPELPAGGQNYPPDGYQSVNARFWHPEIQEVNRDEPSCPIILAEAIKRKCDIPFQARSRARDKKKNLAHVNVFGSNAPNEPVLFRS